MDPVPLLRDRRPDALGHLHILSDELICAILDYLSPSDLIRLSCASSVLYIFCNEEPLWMNLCLRDGGPLEYESSWKRTTLFRQNLLARNSEHQSHPPQFDGFSSLHLYRRWYRCFTTLNSFSFDSEDLERRKSLTMDELNYTFDEKKPILLTEVANTWPARYKWTVDHLLSNYGNVAFRLSQRSSKKITMKFKDYVSYMRIQHDEDPLYIFDDKFGEAAPTLLQDYCAPSLFQEDFFDVLDCDQRPPFRWLIIGPERSGASWHVDPCLTSAWNTLFCGKKRWALYPPGRVPAGVTVHVNEDDGDVNIESPSSLQWWLDVYPLLADQDKPLECTQLPGETIFVPSGWWHCVLNLDTTIAVTQNFVNASNFEFVCLDMSPGHVHKGVCRAGLLAVQNCYIEHPKGTEENKMNLLRYPYILPREKRLKAMLTHTDHNDHLHSWNSVASNSCNDCNPKFSYDIDFLSMFLNKKIDHYNTIWSPSSIVGEREMRAWLHRLWLLKPEIRNLIWKGSCLALNVEKWLACLLEICTHYNLTLPLDEEKFPVGTGSNPVFLVSDNVIKIFVEGGLESSLHGLGTELEFYSLLAKTKSPLINHVPDIIASGFVAVDGSGYRTYPWDGRGVPDVITDSIVCGTNTKNEFPYGVWSKKKFELEIHRVNACSTIWPFIVSKRCDGEIFTNLRDILSKSEAFHLASFLGEQLRHLHLLPLPNFGIGVKETSSMEGKCHEFNTSREWELVIATLERRKSNILSQLAQC